MFIAAIRKGDGELQKHLTEVETEKRIPAQCWKAEVLKVEADKLLHE